MEEEEAKEEVRDNPDDAGVWAMKLVLVINLAFVGASDDVSEPEEVVDAGRMMDEGLTPPVAEP